MKIHPSLHIGDRTAFQARFDELFPVADSSAEVRSPCGRYTLELCRHTEYPEDMTQTTFLKKPGGIDYSSAVVRETEGGRVIAEVRRNHPLFWWEWIDHPNGNAYLLCAEDVAGYSVINLTSGETSHYCPPGDELEGSFEWQRVFASPDRNRLAVAGKVLNEPDEERGWFVMLDFSEPDSPPFKELSRGRLNMDLAFEGAVFEKSDSIRWRDNDAFAYQNTALYFADDGSPVDPAAPATETENRPVRKRTERVTLQPGQEPVIEDPSEQ